MKTIRVYMMAMCLVADAEIAFTIQTTINPAVALLKSVDIFGDQLVQLLNVSNSTTMQISTPNLCES